MDTTPWAGTLSRRAFVRAMGAGSVALASPELWFQPDAAGAPDPEQLHLQFGQDASREVVVSWATAGPVRHPRLRLGLHTGGFGRTVPAETRTYVDARSGQEVFTH